MKRLWMVALLFIAPTTHAGVMELGLTANYRQSSFDENNFQSSLSYTGSISYYFWELSALELSYTNGLQTLSTKATDTEKLTYRTRFELIGLDLVFTFAGRNDPFQPYIKFGGAYIKKEFQLETASTGTQALAEPEEGVVPSGGIGCKIKLTKTLRLKIGADAWSSPLDEKPVVWDYAGRAGITWLF